MDWYWYILEVTCWPRLQGERIISGSDVYWTMHRCDNWRMKNQLDATCYFIVLLISSTCFRHYYAHHQELATVMLITTFVVSFLVCCMLEVRCGCAGVVSGLQAQAQLQLCLRLQPRHHSILTAPYLQHTANQELYDQCGKQHQHHSRGLLMMGTVMSETCWAYKKYNKITSGI